MKNIPLKSMLIHLVAIVVFVLAAATYFAPQFSGKKINQGDTIFFLGMAQEINAHHEKTGEWSQWTNSGFGGMPAYQIKSVETTNLTRKISKALSLWMPRPAGMFFFGAICFYLMALVLGVHPWLGIIGGLAFAFATNNVVLFEAGHNTKILTIMSFPLVIAGVIQAYKGKLFTGSLIFALGMSLSLGANHPQMVYYLGLLLGIYVLIRLGIAIKEKELPTFAKASGFLLIGLFLAIGTSAGKLLPTYEYSKDTMRGKPILKSEGAVKSSSEVDGLDWDYATAWSNGWKDLWPSYIPLAVGGSSSEKISDKTSLGRELKKRGMNLKTTPLPIYFGDLTITMGPIYFGAVVCYLFLLCFPYLEPQLKWWGVASVILTMLLSVGYNMEFLYRFFFDYFPFFNKFRTPNSILSVTSLIVPLIGILALDQFFKKDLKNISTRGIIIPAAVLILGALLLAFVGPTMMSFESRSDAQLIQAGIKASVLEDTRISMMQGSAYRTIIFIALAAAAMLLYLKGKVNAKITMLIVGALALSDLFLVDKGYLNNDDFITERTFDRNFEVRPVDEEIFKDTDLHYRVMDMSATNPWSSSTTSYHHSAIGGMHAAKLQRYQDIMEKHLSQNNQAAYDMLNTKYFIGNGQDGKLGVQKNPGAAGNAWFVEDIIKVPTANDEIKALNGIDVSGAAVIHAEFSDYLGGLDPTKNGTIKLTSYAPNKLVYSTSTGSEQLAVFSEVWYGPNKGWKASIDGQPVEHIRANYVLRAMKVPAGKHEIVFEFNPSSYRVGKIIALICSLIIIGGLLFWAFKWFKQDIKA